jgi:hypothetical protein
MQIRRRICAFSFLGASAMLAIGIVGAEEPAQSRHHQSDAGSREAACKQAAADSAASEAFDGIQVETSDIGLFEQFFQVILQAPLIQHAEHPHADRLRGYCYRGVRVVVRQDLRTARPAGWVQLNFRVSDVSAVQQEIEQHFHVSSIARLSEAERNRIVRFRFKADVMRGEQKVARFEVAGPEGFMIGFDQVK